MRNMKNCKHEHIGWYGGTSDPQWCSECKKTIDEIVAEAYAKGLKQGKKEGIDIIQKVRKMSDREVDQLVDALSTKKENL